MALIVSFGEWNRKYNVQALWSLLEEHGAEFLDARPLFQKRVWNHEADLVNEELLEQQGGKQGSKNDGKKGGKKGGKGGGKKPRSPHYFPEGEETDTSLRAQAYPSFFECLAWRPAQKDVKSKT